MRPKHQVPASLGAVMRDSWRIVVLVTSIMLAGCLADVDEENQPEREEAQGDLLPAVHGVDGKILTGQARAGMSYHTGMNAFEPTIGVDESDAIFMQAGGLITAGDDGWDIAASFDGGGTWSAVGPRIPTTDQPTHAVGFDPYVLVDKYSGRVWMADLVVGECLILSWSEDQGETWITNPRGCAPTGLHDHQTLAVGPSTTALPAPLGYILYVCGNQVQGAECMASRDGGLTFPAAVPVRPGSEPTVFGNVPGHLEAADDGTLYLPLMDDGNAGGTPVMYRSDDEALTWTRIELPVEDALGLESTEHDFAIAADPDGLLFVSWTSRDGLLRLMTSDDRGESWSQMYNITPPQVTATGDVSLIAVGPGKVASAFIGIEDEGGYEDKSDGASPVVPQSAAWHGYIQIITQSGGEITIESSRVNDEDEPLALGHCGRTRCRGMGDFFDIAVDSQGIPWAAFVDVEKTPTGKPEGLVGTLMPN